jgi:hypothetical protein
MAAPDLLACGAPKHDSCETAAIAPRVIVGARFFRRTAPLFSDRVLAGVRGHGAAKLAGCYAIAALE